MRSGRVLTGELAKTSGARMVTLLDPMEGVTIGRRSHHRHCADRARGARHVLQQKRLTEHRLHVIRIEPEVLAWSAGPGWHRSPGSAGSASLGPRSAQGHDATRRPRQPPSSRPAAGAVSTWPTSPNLLCVDGRYRFIAR